MLVGHSFGGIAISVAAEAAPQKIGTLVYVAAYLPRDGQSLLDLGNSDKDSKAKVFAEGREGREERDASLQAGHSKERSWRQRREGQEPQASHRDRSFQGAKERRESTSKTCVLAVSIAGARYREQRLICGLCPKDPTRDGRRP